MKYRIASLFMVCLTMVAFLVVPVVAASGGGSSLPDLKVTKIEVLSPLQPGGQVSVRVTCENSGGSTSGSFPIEGWIFAQPDYAFSLKMGTIMASGLTPGGSASYTFTFTLPSNAPSGKYDVKVAADNSNYTDAGNVQEQNENNNEKWLTGITGAVVVKNTPTRVTTPVAATPSSGGMADLWVSGVSGPKTAPAGGTIEITAEVGNDGNIATPAADLLYGLVFSTNTKKAYVIGNSVTTQGFSPYSSGKATRQVTLPDNVPPGDYYIGVWIDHDRKIADVNIDNNLASSNPGFITITAPVESPVVTPIPTRVVQAPVKTATPVSVQTPVSTPTPASVRTAAPVSTPTPTVTVDPVTGCYPLNGPMTITQSGTYCIGRDFSGLVKVKVSDVTIKGNGHTISKSGEVSGIAAGDVYDSKEETYTQLKGFTVEDVKFAGSGLSASNVDDIVFTRITTSGISGYAGIYMFSCRGVTITDSVTEYGTLSDGRSYGIGLRDVFDVVLNGNTLKSNTGDGIMLTGVSGLDCTGNTFEGNSEYGLYISAPVGSHISQPVYVDKNRDIRVIGNTFRKNLIGGLGLMDCPGAVIERNTFEEGGAGIVTWMDCTGMVIEDNTIRNNKGSAIIINRGSPGPCIIRDNIIDNNYSGEATSDGWGVTKNADGISLGGNGHTVTGNTITNNDVGIRIYWDAEKSTISNNKIVNRINFFAQGGVGPYGAKIAENTWNIKKTPGTNIMDGPYLGGNFWGQPDGKGFSQVTQDADGDGFCDHPYQLNEKNTDALPLVDYRNPPKIIKGGLSVTSVPAGAAITLDGESRGVAPATLSDILEGTHTITLKKSGYVDYSGTIEVKAGQTVKVDQKLTPVPPPTPTVTKTPPPKPTSTAKPTVAVKTPTSVPLTPVATPTKQPTAVSQPTAVVIPTKTVKPTVTTLKPTNVVVQTKTPLPPTQVPQDPCSPPAGSTFEEKMAAAIFTETNKARAAYSLPALCWDPKITTVSKGFASAMAAVTTMPSDHNLPGNLADDRSKTIRGFGYKATSENIATGTSGNVYTDCNGGLHKVPNTPEGIAEFVVDMWMNHDTCHADGHKNNILGKKYAITHIGAGVVKGSNGKYYIAQDFGMK